MRLHANRSNRAVSERLGEFSARLHKTARRALFFTFYDVFDVNGWFPSENIRECVRFHANGSNRVVSVRLGQFSALLQKTAWGAVFFTCFDLFDVIGWFASENIKECVRLHANSSNWAI